MSKKPGAARANSRGEVQYSLYLKFGLYDRVADLANRRRQSMAELVREALRHYLADYE